MSSAIDRQSLQTLYGYNAYANGLVLDTLARLRDAEYEEVISPNYTSIRKLVTHSFLTERFFFAHCQDHPVSTAAPQTLAELRDEWTAQAKEGQAYLAGADESELSRPRSIQMIGQPFQFSAWQLLTQALMHSTHHRGEMAIMLGAMGHPLPTLDIIVYFSEQAGKTWPWK